MFPTLSSLNQVSTHSRAEAAARFAHWLTNSDRVSTHSRAEAAAYFLSKFPIKGMIVSTHSRAEAAASREQLDPSAVQRFNTQPRGGGCELLLF